MTLITLTCAIFKDAKDKAKNFHSCRIFAIEKVSRFLGLWCKKPKKPIKSSGQFATRDNFGSCGNMAKISAKVKLVKQVLLRKGDKSLR